MDIRTQDGNKDAAVVMPISTCCIMLAAHSMAMELCSIRISHVLRYSSWQSAERLFDELIHGLQKAVGVLEHLTRVYGALGDMKGK